METELPKTNHTRSRYNALSSVYNIMEWPVEQLWYKKWRPQLWNMVNGPKVLELGVGTGKNIPYYPNEMNITGIDLSPGMLKRSKKVLLKSMKDSVTLREMDAQQMDFPDNSFDEVVTTFVFCSVPDPVAELLDKRSPGDADVYSARQTDAKWLRRAAERKLASRSAQRICISNLR